MAWARSKLGWLIISVSRVVNVSLEVGAHFLTRLSALNARQRVARARPVVERRVGCPVPARRACGAPARGEVVGGSWVIGGGGRQRPVRGSLAIAGGGRRAGMGSVSRRR
jgi:hypothetical protein